MLSHLALTLGSGAAVDVHTVCSGLEGARRAECGALAAFGVEHEFATWTKHRGWLQGEDYCSWEGVKCHTATQRVQQLVLINVGVPGSLANLGALAALDDMEDLVLMMNQLTGTIPDIWTQFPRLHYLGLDQNHLTGSIPPSVGAMRQLKELIVWGNQLTGTLPSTLAQCTDLETISASANALHGAGLTGTIPDLSPLTKLSALYLQENHLEGAVPASLNAVTAMKRLWLNDNLLTGAVPDLSALAELDMLHLENNRLRTVPAAFCDGVPRECGLHGNDFDCASLPPCVAKSGCSRLGAITCSDGAPAAAPVPYSLDDPTADHRARAIALDVAGDEAGAVASFRAATVFSANDSKSWHNFAVALLGANAADNRAEAIACLRKAIALNAGDADSAEVLEELMAEEPLREEL